MSLSQQLLGSSSQDQKSVSTASGSASSRLLGNTQNTQGNQTSQFQGYKSTSSIVPTQLVVQPPAKKKTFVDKTKTLLGIGTGEVSGAFNSFKNQAQGFLQDVGTRQQQGTLKTDTKNVLGNVFNYTKDKIIEAVEKENNQIKGYFGENTDIRKLNYEQIRDFESNSFLDLTRSDIQTDIEKLESKKNKSSIDKYRIKNYKDTLAKIDETKNLPFNKKYKADSFINGLALGRNLSSLTAGLLNIGESFFDFVKWRGDKAEMENISEFSEKAGDRVNSWAEEVRPNNPQFADKLLEGAGSTIPFYITGLGISSLTGRIASVSPKIAKVFGVASSAFMESGLEAGSTYQANIDRGLSKEEADLRAGRVFLGNVAFNYFTDRYGLFSDAEGVKRIITAGLAEGTQETWQNGLQNLALDQDFMQGAGETFILSFITGAGLSNLGNVLQDPAVRASINEEDLKKLDKIASEVESGKIASKEDIAPEKPTETKKYKNAKKFIEAQPKVYHATSEFSKQLIEDKGFELGFESDRKLGTTQKVLGEGIYFGESEEGVSQYGDEVVTASISPDAKIKELSMQEISDIYNEQGWGYGIVDPTKVSDYFKSLGYDGIHNTTRKEIVVFDPKNVRTTKQLTDIYNQPAKTEPEKPKGPEEKKVVEETLAQMQARADKLKEVYQDTKNGDDLRAWRKLQNEVEDLQTKQIADKESKRVIEQKKADEQLRKTDESIDSLDETDTNTLTNEAQKFETLDEFMGKMHGSATQYGDYTPKLRKFVRPESKLLYEITDLGPEDTITVYRGIEGSKGTKINNGDFVTTDSADAQQYIGPDGKVVSLEAKAKNLINEDPNEEVEDNTFYELIYQTKPFVKITDTKLTDIYNKAHGIEPKKPKTPEKKPVKPSKIGLSKTEEPDHIKKGRELSTKLKKEDVFDKVVKEARAYAKRNDTYSEYEDDINSLGGSFGEFEGNINFKKNKVTVELADGREFTFKNREIYDKVKKPVPKEIISEPLKIGKFYRVEILRNDGVSIGNIQYKVAGDKILVDMIRLDAEKRKGYATRSLNALIEKEGAKTARPIDPNDVSDDGREFFDNFEPTIKKITKPTPKKFTPKKVKAVKPKSISVKDRKAIQAKTKEVAFSGQTQEEAIENVEKYMDEVFSQADDPTFTRKLKVIRAELKRDMYQLVGADTGHWKRDYAFFQKLRYASEAGELVETIENNIFRIDEIINPDAPPSVGGSLASSVTGGQIDSFENRSVPKKGTNEFKLFEQSRALIRKYAQSIGEGYLPRKALGVYYPKTKNIRVNALNNLSTVAHEITHFLDYQYKITDKLLAISGYTTDGKPIYDPRTKKFRKEITEIYTKYYPGGKKTHKLRKRAEEGFATLLQKYTETPNKITEEFPSLVKAFLTEGGQYYYPVMGEILKDLNEIIKEYQGLSSLDKIGSRITSDDVAIDKDSFLNFFDKVRTQLVDEGYPIEVLAKKSGTHFTSEDPSLWLRAYNSVSGIVNTNISSKKGYWSLRGNDFKKIHDFNWKTLVDTTMERKNTDDFGAYLVARREHFAYQELDVMAEEVLRLKENLDARLAGGETKEEIAELQNDEGQTLFDQIKEAMTNYNDLKSILDKDGFSRKIVDETYTENELRFKEEEKMFDTLTRDDLDFLASENVQLITPSKLEKLTSKQGYASFKRQFYDEILGDSNEFPNIPRIGGTKASSLIRRKGSEKTIIHPMYSGIANHSEIMRKGLKQVVYNKITDIGVSATFPNLFQEQQLKTYIDPNSGAIIYPQEKDSNIIMGRKDYKRKPVLVDKEVKSVLDSLLTYENVEIFEKLYVGLSRLFTAGTTGLYPAFAASNFIVDQITASANTTNKYIPIYSALSEFSKVFKDKTGVDYKYYEEYMIMGGERQTFTGWQKLPPNQLYKRINGEKKGLEKATSLMTKGTDILSTPSKYSEIVTRATEYIKARKAGKSQIVALEEAGRVTAPFHHLGKWGGKGGSTFIRGLPFFNATLQVLDQGVRTMETPEGRKRTSVVLMLITTAYLASMLKLLDADDDQKEQYKDLEARELTNYIYFPDPSGKKLIRVKMSQSFSTVGAILNMIIADQVFKTKYSVKDYATASTAWLPDQFNPIDPIQAFLAWIPQIFSTGIETIFNTKTYPEVSPIESMGLSNLPPSMRTNENTSVFAKWLGEKANLSPIKIDYLLTGYFGRSIGFATGKPSAYDFKSSVIRDYYFSGGRRVSGVYDLKEKNDQDYTAYQRGEKDLTEEEVEELYRIKLLTNDFGEIMRDYRKVDIEKDQEKASLLRNEALQLINQIDNGDEPEGLDKWSYDASKRRNKKIIELEEEGLSDASTKKGFSLIKQAQASELERPSTGENKDNKFEVWDLSKTGDGSGNIIFLTDNSQIPVRSSKGKTTDKIIENQQKEVEAINRAAKEFDVDPGLMVDIALQENLLKNVSHTGGKKSSAVGLFGMLDKTWEIQVADFKKKGHGELLSKNPSRTNPEDNAMITAFMLKKQMISHWKANGNHIKWSKYYSDEELEKYGTLK